MEKVAGSNNERATELVTFKDGRSYTIQELNENDVIIAKKVLNAKSAGDMMALPEVLMAFAIVEINKQKVMRPTSMPEIGRLMSKIKLKDYAKLDRAYKNLNEEDEAGEVDAAE